MLTSVKHQRPVHFFKMLLSPVIFLQEHRIITGISITSLIVLSHFLMGLYPDMINLMLVFSVTMVIYLIDSLDLKLLFDFNKQTKAKILFWICFMSFIFLMFMADTSVVLLTFGILAVGTIYNVPIFKNKNRILTLKNVTLVKPFFLSLLISSYAVLIPFFQGTVNLTIFFAASIIIFAYVFSNVVLCDVTDYEDDCINGVPTLPVLIGKHASTNLLTNVNLSIFVLILTMKFFLPSSLIHGIMLPGFTLVVLFSLSYKTITPALKGLIELVPVFALALLMAQNYSG